MFGLDVVRFTCALMVAVFHLTCRNENLAYLPFGWIGVQVFFVISGAVIAKSASATTPFRFLKGRFLRLYPVAWIVALINIGVLLLIPRSVYEGLGVTVVPQPGAFVRSVTLIGDYFLASSYWTLPIELAFYLLVFAALLAGRRVHLLVVARSLVLISAPYVVVKFTLLNLGVDAQWLDLGFGMKNMLLLCFGVYFAIGIYFWALVDQGALKRIDRSIMIIALIAAGIEIYIREIRMYPVLVFFCFAGTIYLSLKHAGAWVPGPRMGQLLRNLGLITYPLYLLHEVIAGALFHHAMRAGLGPVTGLCVALAGAMGLAYLTVRYAEPVVRRRASRSLDWIHARAVLARI